MTKETKIDTLASALVAAFAEIEGAAKDKINPHFKSKYADLSSVIDAIKPVLAKYDLAFCQRCQPSESGVLVETRLIHVLGGEMDMGTLFVPANKNDAQGFGSALTYARRYALMTAFGVPAEDDDGNAAVASAKAPSGKVSEAQLHKLQDAANASGADLQRFCAYLQVASLKDVPAERFQEALDALAAKAKRKEPEMAK